MDVFEKWLSLSKAVPLSLAIIARLSHEQPQFPIVVLSRLIKTLHSCSDRWQHLGLHIPLRWDNIFAEPSGRVPLLEALEWVRHPSEKAAWLQHGQALRMAPRLRWLRIHSVDVWPLDLGLQWHHITHLDLSNSFSVQQTMSVIMHCTELKSCRLVVEEEESSWPLPPVVPLQHLHSLDVTVTFDVSLLLDNFVTPALKELYLRTSEGMRPRPIDPRSFQAFIERSSCTLHTLRLEDLCSSDVEVIALIELLPSLVKLSLDYNDLEVMTDRVLSYLDASNKLTLPLLQHLDLVVPIDMSGQGVVEVIKSRWRLHPTTSPFVSRLQHAGVSFLTTEVPDGIYLLQELQKEGLRVSLSWAFSDVWPNSGRYPLRDTVNTR